MEDIGEMCVATIQEADHQVLPVSLDRWNQFQMNGRSRRLWCVDTNLISQPALVFRLF